MIKKETRKRLWAACEKAAEQSNHVHHRYASAWWCHALSPHGDIEISALYSAEIPLIAIVCQGGTGCNKMVLEHVKKQLPVLVIQAQALESQQLNTRREYSDDDVDDLYGQRAAAYTNVSERALYKWVAEHDKHGEVLSPETLSCGGRSHDGEQLLNEFNLGVLGRVMHGFYKQWEIRTVRKLAANLKEADSLPSVSATAIYRMLLKVGFRFKKCYRNSLLIEATHINQWRRKYLRQIKEVRRLGDPSSTLMKLG
ncbi:hypothetical protein HPB51_008400 [Rhipicephalus microplus]|uniref:Transposase n=1 Tax=Rhipicephalus microplus TaxID=6941 RepID=A0A9J6DTF2_RHIMP|nr:hypothetical protein HPB51_008400 [Rhipicephalus microplus]